MSPAPPASPRSTTCQVPTPILAGALGYNANFVAERAANLSTSWNTYAALKR